MGAFSAKGKLVLVILLIAAIVTSCAFVYVFIFRTPMGDDVVKVGYSVSYNSIDGSVLVNVTSYFNQNNFFDRAIVKDMRGQVLASNSFGPTLLPAFESINLTINLGDVVLASGQSYDVELYTTDGKCYSPVLTVYENVRTRVSLVSADTLLVDVQSFANQTIIFDKATINDWTCYQFNEEYRSIGQDPVDTTLPHAKLAPNENLSFTLLYEKGFSPGNYTFFLYSSSPESQYVGGAYAFFTVTGLEDCFNRVATIEKIAFDDLDNSTLLVDVHYCLKKPSRLQMRLSKNEGATFLQPYLIASYLQRRCLHMEMLR